jgi:hypothetical protein
MVSALDDPFFSNPYSYISLFKVAVGAALIKLERYLL